MSTGDGLVAVAEKDRLSDQKLATIVAGQRPADLTPAEAVAYDVAAALTAGGVLPELTYRAGGQGVWRERRRRAGVSCRPLLPGVGDAERL